MSWFWSFHFILPAMTSGCIDGQGVGKWKNWNRNFPRYCLPSRKQVEPWINHLTYNMGSRFHIISQCSVFLSLCYIVSMQCTLIQLSVNTSKIMDGNAMWGWSLTDWWKVLVEGHSVTVFKMLYQKVLLLFWGHGRHCLQGTAQSD